MKSPVERLREGILTSAGVAAIVYSGKNRRYFTQFPSSEGMLLVTQDEAYLLLDSRYSEAGGHKAKNCKVIGYKNLAESLVELLKKHEVKEVYLEADTLTVSMARRIESMLAQAGAQAVLDETLDNAIRRQRMIKSKEEVEMISAAQAITDATFTHILDFIRPGRTEREISLEMEFYMRSHGADGLAFPSIVAAGPQGSMPHAVPSDYEVKSGDLVTMDFGAALAGYNSDMTRTVAVGEISDEQRDIYETVLRAHLAVLAAAKPGVVCKDMDKVGRDIIDERYTGAMGHSVGHGVGLDIHEWPTFSPRDDSLCEPGMVITDEPGIYIPGKWGVRIEDMLLITEDGCRSLTGSPKELITL